MRTILLLLIVSMLTGCGGDDAEPVTTSVAVDEARLESLFAAIDDVTDDVLDAGPLIARRRNAHG